MMEQLASLINIDVAPFYIEERLVQNEPLYIFGYHITIKNNSLHPVQLLSRHWVITDSDGNKSEVKGDGVVGVQPIIEPNEAFEYSSGSNFRTPVGTMHGQYTMISKTDNPINFDVDIAPFLLADKKIIQ